jgi:hypothetical protein
VACHGHPVPLPSPFLSSLLHHVKQTPLTPLSTTRPSLDEKSHHNVYKSTWPGAPRHAHARASARTASALDAPERDDAHRLASPPPSLSAPVDARHHPDAPRHGHLPAGTPQVTSASTTDRHDLRAPVKLTAAVDPRLHRHHARQPRQDASNRTRPSLASSPPWNDDDDGDPSSAPQPPLAAIKGGLLLSIRAHHSLPLLTTALLDLSIESISHPTAPIARSPPPPVHGVRRSRRPPLETPLLPSASPSSTTSLQPLSDHRRAASEPPTPHRRCASSHLSSETTTLVVRPILA